MLKLGSGPACEIVLDDPKVSRIHALIESWGDVTITDLFTTAGTSVNGVRSSQLTTNALIDVGDSQIRVQWSDS